MRRIQIPRVFWGHAHLRQAPGCAVVGESDMERLIHVVLKVAGAVVPMPNTVPSITTPRHAADYAAAIRKFWGDGGYSSLGELDVIKTLKLTQTDDGAATTPYDVGVAFEHGIRDWKLFPRATPKRALGQLAASSTNTADAVYDVYALFPTFRRMEELRCRLHWHLEDANEPNLMKREFAALPMLEDVVSTFPKLPVIVEHVSDRRTFFGAERYPNVRFGVTAHHLWGTYEWWQENPHHKCAPVMKTELDRQECLDRAIHDPRCYCTPDEAAHHVNKKWNLPPGAEPANECYTGPNLVELVATKFAERGALDKLGAFLTHRGRALHDLKPETRMITLVEEAYPILGICPGEIVPFMAGTTLPWSIGFMPTVL